MSEITQERLVTHQYVTGLIGYLTLQQEIMTTAEKAHSAGILANTFLTHNVTNRVGDTYAVDLEALSSDEQETVAELFEAAEWGEVFHSSGMRRISDNLHQAFDKLHQTE